MNALRGGRRRSVADVEEPLPPGAHRHRCAFCGTRWRHERPAVDAWEAAGVGCAEAVQLGCPACMRRLHGPPGAPDPARTRAAGARAAAARAILRHGHPVERADG